MPTPVSDPLLSVSQAARLLGVHANTIRAWTESGRLPAYRINDRGDRRYRSSEVGALLVSQVPHWPPPDEGDEMEIALLGRFATSVSDSTQPAGVPQAVVQALQELMGLERVAVYAAQSDDAVLQLCAHLGFGDLPGTLSSTEAADWTGPAETQVVPLTAGTSTVGLLVLEASAGASFSLAFWGSLGAIVASRLALTRMLLRARLEVRRARALRTVTRELTGNLDLSRVLADILEQTRTLFGAERAGIWLFDGSPHPVPLVTRSLSADFLEHSAELTPTSHSLSVRSLNERRPLWMRDAHTDPEIGEMRATYAAEGIRTVCMAPLISQGRGLGVIGLYHDEDRVWPDEEVSLAQAFADQAAVAIQNARLYRSVAEHAARIRSIHDLSGRLNRLTDVRAIAEAIVEESRAIADYHDIRVYRVDRERGICEPIAFTREMLVADPAEVAALLTLRIGEGFTGWVAEHGEPLLINNALDDPRGKTIEGTDDVPESMLVVPMLYDGRTLGVIALSQLGFDRFTDDDLQTMGIFASYAAQAMANATTYGQLTAQSSELERRAESHRRLLEVNQRVLWTLDQGDILETIADGLREVVAHDNLSIYRADHLERVMLPVLVRETHVEAVTSYVIPFGRGLMGWALDHRQAVLANDALADPRAVQVPGTPSEPEAVIVVPLVADGVVLGAMNLSRHGGAEICFSEDDFQLVQLFATQAAIALRNADTHHAMSQRAETDALTGLLNHGAFQRDLARVIKEAGGEGQLSLLMMDLDRFKAYNDRHGHPAGDELLAAAAAAIGGTARGDDRVYRYGGDEFALILPGATVDEAERVAGRLRRAVATLTEGKPSPVTITVGIAGMPTDATDRPGLIAAADGALYFGKRAGENCAVRADAIPSRRRSDTFNAPDEGLDAA